MKKEGRCVTIQVSLAGQAVVWALGLLLMTLGTVQDEPALRAWALLCSAGAASWTIISAVTRQNRMIVRAFELGREEGERLHTVG